jgi:hypothetical protein
MTANLKERKRNTREKRGGDKGTKGIKKEDTKEITSRWIFRD